MRTVGFQPTQSFTIFGTRQSRWWSEEVFRRVLGVQRRIQEPRGQANLASLFERLASVPPIPAAVAVVRSVTGPPVWKLVEPSVSCL